MSLLDEVRRCLQAPAPARVAAEVPPDALVERWRRVIFGALARHPAADPWLKEALRVCSNPGAVEARCGPIWSRLVGCWDGVLDEEVLAAAVDAAVRLGLKEEVSPEPFPPALWLQIRSAGGSFLDLDAAVRPHPLSQRPPVSEWLWRLQLLDASGRGRTELGDLILRLPDRDLVRGLLLAELATGTPVGLGWRVDAEGLRTVLQQGSGSEWVGDGAVPAALERLLELGVIDGVSPETAVLEWSLPEAGADVLKDVLASPPTPLGALVRALVSDAGARHMSEAGGPVTSPAGDATRDVYEMVAHELRNTIVTLRGPCARLRHRVEGAAARELDHLERGLEQLDAFSGKLAMLSDVGATAQIDLLAVLHDAVRETTIDRNGHQRVELRATEAVVEGQRAQLQMVVAELLRNAARACRGRESVVLVELTMEPEGVVLAVDDDGPGVVGAERMFERGYTTTGNSGLGLYHARGVVERAMGGTLRHAVSIRGGARFELRFPSRREG